MNRTHRSARGFTLIELLVVITIIGMLSAILIPSILGALKSAKRARALGQIRDLDGAVKRYFAEYGKMPAPKNRTDATTFNGGKDMLFTGADQARVVEVLVNANTYQNPKQIVFLDLDPASFGVKTAVEVLAALARGEPYKDPWGGGYGILMDLNFDEHIDKLGNLDLGGATNILAKVAVFSGGEKTNTVTPPYKTW